MVKTGIINLLNDSDALNKLKNRKIALLVNQTAIDDKCQHVVMAFHNINTNIKKIFTPEHGFFGSVQYMEGINSNRYYDIPVISLYGRDKDSFKPEENDLEDIDCVIYDIQDIGTRYYTYLATLTYLCEACEKKGIEVIVLDRPNPINGVDIEGGLVSENLLSFVGLNPIPARHGLTAGEFLNFLKITKYPDLKTRVFPCSVWKRQMYYDETGLLWVMPSPNMPTIDTAIVYPGMCLLEGTNLSEGRGTTKPFEIFGGSFIKDPFKFMNEINKFKIDGAILRPLFFVPAFDKFKGETCGGLQIHVINRNIFKPLRFGISILLAVQRLYGDNFKWRTQPYEFVSDRLAIDLLLGKSHIREMIESEMELDEIMNEIENDKSDFIELREKCLIY